MRVLLIATNRHDRLQSRMNAQPMPIGLAYIAGHLDPDRHQIKVLDLMFSDDHLADVEAAVKEFSVFGNHVINCPLPPNENIDRRRDKHRLQYPR